MRIATLSIMAALAATPAIGQSRLHDFLKSVAAFDDGDLRQLDGGEIVTKTLDTEDNELALLGAARVQGTIEAFLELYRDIETFEAKLGTARLFSSPPRLSDLDELDFDKGEVQALRRCEIDDCEIKLGEQTLEELRSAIDWSAPDAHDQVVHFLRERLLAYTEAYMSGGNTALAVYRNQKKPRYVASEFEVLLENSPYLLQYRPELHDYLLKYPDAELDGATDFIYWSVINFGPKPTLRVNHVTIFPIEEGANGATLISSKQLYYSHYFDTGLELYTLVPDAERPENGFYLVALNRYRTDLGGGLTGKVMRLGARAGTSSAMKNTIAAARAAVEGR